MGIRDFLARHCAYRGSHRHWFARRLAHKLKLDQVQLQRLARIEDAVRQLRDDAREGWNYRREGLLNLLSGEHLDRDEVLRLARVPSAMVNDALPPLVDAFGDFFDVLDTAQRAQFRKMVTWRLGSRCGVR